MFDDWEAMWRRPFDRPELVGAWPAKGIGGDPDRARYAAILADPPWHFNCWAPARMGGTGYPSRPKIPDYETLPDREIAALPVANLAADNCVLFLWTCWPMLERTFPIIEAWGFTYKTCAFSWIKAHAGQLELFRDDLDVQVGLGYWTRSNSEVCLLATKGKPKRLNADVRQGIIEPRREHSRKPDCVYDRIERLVAGPYLELFARQQRIGWDSWGNEVTKYNGTQRATGPAID